jgi:glycosyltransferase involved in cell wall biosynthesis
MNILFLSELFYPHGSGAELATYLYATLLNEAGLKILVVTNRFDGEPQVSSAEGLTIYRLPLFKQASNIRFTLLSRLDIHCSSILRKLMKWADVVYVPRLWFSAIPLAKICGRPVITHLHDYVPICPLSNCYDLSKESFCSRHGFFCRPRCIFFYEKNLGRRRSEIVASTVLNSTIGGLVTSTLRLSDVVLCVSKVQRDIILGEQPYLAKKTQVLYNPIPEISYKGVEGDDFGYFGGPDWVKGFRTLVRAMSRIVFSGTKRPVVQATAFGARAIADKGLIRRLGELGFRVSGRLSQDDLEKLYPQIRAVLVPSVCPEPWPYTVVEALVRGRFVIGSSVGGITEQFEGCKGVALCEPASPEQLSEAILYAASLSREQIADLGCGNRGTYLARFDNQTTIRRFISVCEHLN